MVNFTEQRWIAMYERMRMQNCEDCGMQFPETADLSENDLLIHVNSVHFRQVMPVRLVGQIICVFYELICGFKSSLGENKFSYLHYCN